ncbi:MAG: zinc-ribbon domain-containing protein [Deltaproteobacteria bacterium]|nr:zinc-ribbon domain-containing protein [Candidatus Zymogenaceae bacterium]
MRVSCPHCGGTGTISDALVPEEGRSIACPKCRTQFTVKRQTTETRSVATSLGTSSDRKIPVRCPACGASGTLPAARIPAGGSAITCPKCNAKFTVTADAPRSPTAPGENVPFVCPQCGREGQLPASVVGEEGVGTNCPGCNARFFVRRHNEAKMGDSTGQSPPTGPAHGGTGGAVSATPGLAGPSVAAGIRTSSPNPVYPGGPIIGLGGPKAAVSAQTLALDDVWSEPSVVRAVMGGGGAAVVGAMIWAFITVMTSFQIGWMAIGVGVVVGFAVKFFGRGTDQTFGFIGAGLALFGCAIGNLMSACAFISTDPRNAGFMSVLFDALGNPGTAVRIMAGVFHPMDVLFYVLAVSTGYKVALRSDKA